MKKEKEPIVSAGFPSHACPEPEKGLREEKDAKAAEKEATKPEAK
jgi:hypothetical protein